MAVARIVAVVASVLATAAPAFAQAQSPPGPYVVDVRGAMMAVPTDPAFHPPSPSGTPLPSRGFGPDVGVHVYLFNVGPARLGIGASLSRISASTSPELPEPSPGTTPVLRTIPDVQVTVTAFAPQLSLNFGARDGWSYISGGYGAARVRSATEGVVNAAERDGNWGPNLNVGGGARWFRGDHLAFGFDIRVHIVGARARPVPATSTPRSTLMAASVGISLR